MGLDRAGGGVEEFRQRVRGLELERTRALASRDADRFAIGGFGGGGFALGEDVASDPVQERFRAVTARLLGEHETLRDRCECGVDRARFALELGENAMPHIRRLPFLPHTPCGQDVTQLGCGSSHVARDEAATPTRPFPRNRFP